MEKKTTFRYTHYSTTTTDTTIISNLYLTDENNC